MSTECQPRLPGRKIIILEDNALIGLELEMALQSEGANVLLCSSPKAASIAMDTQNIDFLLTDFFLSDGVSLSVIEEAVARRIPYALITGYPLGEIEMRLPAAKIFGKPCMDEEVINHISITLGPVTSELHDSPISEETNSLPIGDSGITSPMNE